MKQPVNDCAGFDCPAYDLLVKTASQPLRSTYACINTGRTISRERRVELGVAALTGLNHREPPKSLRS